MAPELLTSPDTPRRGGSGRQRGDRRLRLPPRLRLLRLSRHLHEAEDPGRHAAGILFGTKLPAPCSPATAVIPTDRNRRRRPVQPPPAGPVAIGGLDRDFNLTECN
ncbi:hypothetical protein OHA59_46875 [Streptomyces sp. NBC_01589]|uniref:hypothetical protein n=1 Tax=Streptomyces sp. NBC_01589 TaxID=2975886 RepID=UPI00386E5B56